MKPKTTESPIVIVDDDPVTAQIFGIDLKEAGYCVQLVSTAVLQVRVYFKPICSEELIALMGEMTS